MRYDQIIHEIEKLQALLLRNVTETEISEIRHPMVYFDSLVQLQFMKDKFFYEYEIYLKEGNNG